MACIQAHCTRRKPVLSADMQFQEARLQCCAHSWQHAADTHLPHVHMSQLVACKAVLCHDRSAPWSCSSDIVSTQTAAPAPDDSPAPALADLVRLLKDPAATHIELKGNIVFSHDFFPPENANDQSKGINITHEVRSMLVAEPPEQVTYQQHCSAQQVHNSRCSRRKRRCSSSALSCGLAQYPVAQTAVPAANCRTGTHSSCHSSSGGSFELRFVEPTPCKSRRQCACAP
jgi:hypothetical protein